MIVTMYHVFIRNFVIKVNSKMCAFSALYIGIGSHRTVQYLHHEKNQGFGQSVWCKYCTIAGRGFVIKSFCGLHDKLQTAKSGNFPVY